MRCCSKATIPPKHQADAVLSQANPVSGTKYTVLDTTKNVRIISISVKCTWTVQPTPLQVHVTIDGQTITYSKTDPVSASNYAPSIGSGTSPIGQLLSDAGSIAYNIMRSFLLEGRSVKIECEITAGTVSNLTARVKYVKW